jgi:hypothetical protein
MNKWTSWAVRVRNLAGLCRVSLLVLAASTAATAQPITVTGLIDARASAGSPPMLLTGARGFSIVHPVNVRDNFLDLSRCTAPDGCAAGTTQRLDAYVPFEPPFRASLDGVGYAAFSGATNIDFRFSVEGAIVLPPIAATATVSAPFSFSGTFQPPIGIPQVQVTGNGTATVYLRSNPGPFPGGEPRVWFVDRVVMRFDSSLPAPWAAVDVGAVGTRGSTAGASDGEGTAAFSVAGAGADVWDAQDAFQFVVAHPGPTEVIARVDGLANTHEYAKAGVMLRQSTHPSSPHVFLAVKPDGDIELLSRPSQGAVTEFLAAIPADFPVWLKISQGDTIAAAISKDGQTWQTVRTFARFPDPLMAPTTPPLIGLAVTSHDTALVNEARFAHVSVATPAPPPSAPAGAAHADVGAVTAAGSFAQNGSMMTMSSSGADIWGMADAFHYAYQPLAADGEIVARVTSLTDTSPWAKAGVMMRDTLDAASAHVLLAARPGGGVEMLYRAMEGGDTTLVAARTGALPVWLRLQRTGTTYVGAVSNDGTSWSTVGTVARAVPGPGTPQNAYIGLAVTSQNPAAVATATFDGVAIATANPPAYRWLSTDVGAVGTPGGATVSATRATVAGAGSDIWNEADAFRFLYKGPSASGGQFQVRVLSQTATDPWAKAGLMIRTDASPGSPFAMVGMLPSGQIELLVRDQANAPAQYIGGAFVGIGGYIEMHWGPSVVSVLYSADGSRFTPVASFATPDPLKGNTLAGLAVTSRDPGGLNVAEFELIYLSH